MSRELELPAAMRMVGAQNVGQFNALLREHVGVELEPGDRSISVEHVEAIRRGEQTQGIRPMKERSVLGWGPRSAVAQRVKERIRHACQNAPPDDAAAAGHRQFFESAEEERELREEIDENGMRRSRLVKGAHEDIVSLPGMDLGGKRRAIEAARRLIADGALPMNNDLRDRSDLDDQREDRRLRQQVENDARIDSYLEQRAREDEAAAAEHAARQGAYAEARGVVRESQAVADDATRKTVIAETLLNQIDSEHLASRQAKLEERLAALSNSEDEDERKLGADVKAARWR